MWNQLTICIVQLILQVCLINLQHEMHTTAQELRNKATVLTTSSTLFLLYKFFSGENKWNCRTSPPQYIWKNSAIPSQQEKDLNQPQLPEVGVRNSTLNFLNRFHSSLLILSGISVPIHLGLLDSGNHIKTCYKLQLFFIYGVNLEHTKSSQIIMRNKSRLELNFDHFQLYRCNVFEKSDI